MKRIDRIREDVENIMADIEVEWLLLRVEDLADVARMTLADHGEKMPEGAKCACFCCAKASGALARLGEG